MTYINIDNLFKLDNPLLLPFLLVLKYASKKDVAEKLAALITDDKELDNLIEKGYIKIIKGKKSDNKIQKIRLDKKGTKFLNDLDEPIVEDEDIKIFDWLANIYKEKEKAVGNTKKTKRLIASFREKSSIEKNNLAFLCNEFINDDNEQEYSHKLENVFWKPKNVFQSKFVLEDSRLWAYYQKRKTWFDTQFEMIK